jgi:hypothetical protein
LELIIKIIIFDNYIISDIVKIAIVPYTYTGGYMSDHAPEITHHVNETHAKPNIFEGSKTPHPKTSSKFENGENTGGDCSK